MLRGGAPTRPDLTPPTGLPSEPRSTQVASTVAPRGLFDRPSRPKSARTGSSTDFFDPSASKRVPKSDFGRSRVDFGCPGGIFRESFAPAGWFGRKCDDLRKTQKNHVFLQVFSMFALARTLRKSTKKPLERASRASRATDHSRNVIFSSFQA